MWGDEDAGEDVSVPVCAGTSDYEHVTVSRRVDTVFYGHWQGGTYAGLPCASWNAFASTTYTHGERKVLTPPPKPLTVLLPISALTLPSLSVPCQVPSPKQP